MFKWHIYIYYINILYIYILGVPHVYIYIIKEFYFWIIFFIKKVIDIFSFKKDILNHPTFEKREKSSFIKENS